MEQTDTQTDTTPLDKASKQWATFISLNHFMGEFSYQVRFFNLTLSAGVVCVCLSVCLSVPINGTCGLSNWYTTDLSRFLSLVAFATSRVLKMLQFYLKYPEK